MKKLSTLMLLIAASSLCSSCGIPAATIRTVQNTADATVTTTSNILGSKTGN